MYCAVLKALPHAPEIRTRERSAHDAYWAPLLHRIWLAGPLLAEDGQRLGQIMIVDAGDPKEAEAIIGNDPFVLRGAFEPFSVFAFRPSVLQGQVS